MREKTNLSIREACVSDRQSLANIIHFEVYVHRHLDWRQPLDWINCKPFFVAPSENKILAAIACPPDPANIAWIRLLAISSDLHINNAFLELWKKIKEYFNGEDEIIIAAIPRQGWFQKLLEESGFILTNHVVMMLWESKEIPAEHQVSGLKIRPMNFDDLQSIEVLDTITFDPVWRISESSLIYAYRQAAIATVAEMDNNIIGYQISTSSHHGGHLARLAIHPKYRRMGNGYNLVHDILVRFNKRGVFNISVNTQMDNKISLALYEKLGFQKTNEVFPTYQYFMSSHQQT